MKTPISLNALRAFEVSARHESFVSAAAELNVTPAAVGQLVRSLEDYVGAPLFHRSTGGRARLVLTETGRKALPDFEAGFERLRQGLTRLQEASTAGLVSVTTNHAFAAKWLLPRIDRFQAAWPDTDVRIDTRPLELDLAAQGLDIGIRYGSGNWPGLTVEKLLTEEVYPVCAPALLNRCGEIKAPADLANQTLIHDLSFSPHPGYVDWDRWFRHAGVPPVATNRGLRITNSSAVLQVAIEGHGVALARSLVAEEDVAVGRLVRLLPDIKLAAALAYYVIYPADRELPPRALAFRSWLFEQVALG